MAQRELGHDAELTATELARRAERLIGQLARDGQEAGAIFTRQTARSTSTGRKIGRRRSQPARVCRRRRSPRSTSSDDVSDDDFEDAITEAKAEGTLSRANVSRKLRGKTNTYDRNPLPRTLASGHRPSPAAGDPPNDTMRPTSHTVHAHQPATSMGLLPPPFPLVNGATPVLPRVAPRWPGAQGWANVGGTSCLPLRSSRIGQDSCPTTEPVITDAM